MSKIKSKAALAAAAGIVGAEAQPTNGEAPVAQHAPQQNKKCGISRADFLRTAPTILLPLQDGTGKQLGNLMAAPKEFSTGSFGWGCNGPIVLTVDGKPVKVIAGVNLTVAHSKDAD